MYKVIVFAGTTEGCEISRFLAEHQVSVCVCVATEYGTKSLKEGTFLHTRSGRMNEAEMVSFLRAEMPELVLDATHPYAKEVTENIAAACAKENLPCIRISRTGTAHLRDAVYVDSVAEAAAYLQHTEGNILLTTGSKELPEFTVIPDYKERIYARVLSLPSVISACSECGVEGKHLIGMQGPFSREMNEAMLRQYQCKYLVTKDTGAAGGFPEKAEAAAACGAVLVVIGRPEETRGISCWECKKQLAERFGFSADQKISLVGIGMGNRETMTGAAQKEVEEAELLIGAERMLKAVQRPEQKTHVAYRSDEIVSYINEHTEYERIAIVLSGDIGFYSGAKKLLELLPKKPEMICGISSVSYFMSKIGLSWDDTFLASAHGRNCNLVSLIRSHRKVFSILGTKDGVKNLARKLADYDMAQVRLYVGENLSYENEKIIEQTAGELTEYEGDALCVICAVNEKAEELRMTHGLKDEEMIRGKVPMTKEEVRTVSLAKLQLKQDSICYDVGAGTGSVSIEMALRVPEGMVYAIEKKEEAVELIEKNRQKFAADNLQVVRGLAPEALEELPAPTHAFIGGSSGNLEQIISLLLRKNPEVRIVINCIALETLSETLRVIRKFRFRFSETVQVGVSRAKEVASYHMMMGENPIYIVTCQHLEESAKEEKE